MVYTSRGYSTYYASCDTLSGNMHPIMYYNASDQVTVVILCYDCGYSYSDRKTRMEKSHFFSSLFTSFLCILM